MYRKDKQFMKNPATASSRIYIGSVAKSVISNDLEEKFRIYGNILGLVLNTGFGFIQYETEAEAQAAIKNENGAVLHGRKLVVKQANKPGGNQPPTQKPNEPRNEPTGPPSGPPLVPPPKPIITQTGPSHKPGPPPNQSPRPNNPPPQKTPPPPPQTQQTPPQNNHPEPPLKFQPPERDTDFQDDNMEDERPNIRPPGPPQHNDDRGRKNVRKNHRGGRGEGRGRSNDRDHFIDRFEPPTKIDMYRDPYYGRGDRDYNLPVARSAPYPPPMDAPPPPEKNDCEIIVVAKALT